MSAKKSKLEEQFLAEATKTDVKENIFKGTSIFVNGYSSNYTSTNRINSTNFHFMLQ